MSIEKIKGLLAKIGLTVNKVSETGLHWTLKMAMPLNTPIEKGAELLTKAGYKKVTTGISGDLEWISVIDPAHDGVGEPKTTETITIEIPKTPEVKAPPPVKEPITEISPPELEPETEPKEDKTPEPPSLN